MLVPQLISQLLPPRFFFIFGDGRKLRNVGVDWHTSLLAPVLLLSLPGNKLRHLENPHLQTAKNSRNMAWPAVACTCGRKKSRMVNGRCDSAGNSWGECLTALLVDDQHSARPSCTQYIHHIEPLTAWLPLTILCKNLSISHFQPPLSMWLEL